MAIRAAVIADAQWEEHKDVIQLLYSKYKLSIVMEKMRNDHDFDATEKQYKRRFSKWDVAKNVKRHEIRWLMREDAAARVLRGQRVPEVKVKRHRRRQRARERSMKSDLSSSLPDENTFPEGALGRALLSINNDLSRSTFPRGSEMDLVRELQDMRLGIKSSIIVQALLLHKMLLLPVITFFNRARSDALLIEDIVSAGPVVLLDMKQTVLALCRRPQDDDIVFRAAFLLYRRRGKHLIAAREECYPEHIAAAVCLAVSGLHTVNNPFENWFLGSQDPQDQHSKAFEARSCMLTESFFPERLDAPTWERWRSLMRQSRQALCERFVEDKQTNSQQSMTTKGGFDKVSLTKPASFADFDSWINRHLA